MINQAVKNEWLKALRSGKYKQTMCQLRDFDFDLANETETESFCCLGVLTDLYLSKEEVQKKWDNEGFESFRDLLPKQVKSWLFSEKSQDDVLDNWDLQVDLKYLPDDLSENLLNGRYGEILSLKEKRISLTLLNDSCKLSFNQIADIIEKAEELLPYIQ